MSKIHRFESIKKDSDYWVEIREVPTSMTTYEYRNKYFPQWEELSFYPGESFSTILVAFRDPYAPYKEITDYSSITAPSFNEMLTTKPADYKCRCEIISLMQQGCKCGGK